LEERSTSNKNIENFIRDLLFVIKKVFRKKNDGESRTVKRIVKHGKTCDKKIYMFLLRNEFFIYSVRFRIYFYFRNSFFRSKNLRKIFECEDKWRSWRENGFPKAEEIKEEHDTANYPIDNECVEEIVSESLFDTFIKSELHVEDSSGTSREWYEARANIFK
jgi:hypothetical protein